MAVARDGFGIPHVLGASVVEVAREQGRATATDRAWQLQVERRRAEGTCAELFGEAALEWDRLARRADLPGLAQRAYAAMSEESRAFVDAYVAGVNDVLAPAGDAQDEAWQPWTPLGVLAVQHLLFSTFPSKLWRHHLAGALAPELRDHLELLRGEGLPGGSNAVAVAGSLTASGLPILAGDPHRVIEAPGVYAQVRLVCTDPEDAFDVTGLTFVGVPGVQHFGHAAHAGGGVAWGITNAVADAEDLYVEHLTRDGDAVVAQGPAGTEPVQHRVEEIRVRGADGGLCTEQLEVLRTGRGPVVLGGPDEVAFSLRTPADVLGDLGGDALLPLLRARTAADVLDAFEDHWVSPVNNLLVAAAAGQPGQPGQPEHHVEHRVVGRVPQREADRAAALHRLPGDARAGTGWTGWVTDLPRRTGEVLVSANDRAAADFARIGDEYAPPFRAARIAELVDALAARGPITPATLAEVLADDKQTAGGPLLDAIADLADLSAPAATLRERLLAWDRRMAPDSIEAPLFARVRAHVVRAVVDGPGLRGLDTSPYGELFAPWFDLGARVQTALPALLAADRPFGVDLATAVRGAVESVAHEPEPEPGTETWGAAHVAVPLTPHQQLGLQPPAEQVPPLLPVAGDTDCVLAARALGGRGACVHGPVARWVWDLAGASRWVVPLGASGDPASPHHHDQQAVWAAGGTLPVVRPTGATMRPVDPDGDADLLHSWVTQPRAAFWGMTERTRDEVAEIYGWIVAQEHLAAYLLEVDGHPVGLLQTYDPFVDEIGEFYDRRPGDLGVHLLLADDPRRRGHTGEVVRAVFAWLLARPGFARLVTEPDARNDASIALLERLGAERGPRVQLRTSISEKPAQFLFLPRSRVEELVLTP
ncbi:GNAT family N-acetyltransferase [Nocardioides sp. zg-ZUI104]|uniref:GNAT family N-acetyltransferase n=1 Tax=Nocardioides faecalis TaxID=2803858 RepID=UPI001BD0268F|nr:GNAT family N-acetyltransferase [Nocardioides faecalis]MBS4754440.1 GNAT family N-acetyltransferase [Nocardioides faecalis]